MSKEITTDEARTQFLSHVAGLVDYWSKVDEKTCREKLGGLAFSILVVLDGGAIDLPGFVVAPSPHPDDRQFHIDEGTDYYSEAPEVECDISGGLHELFYGVMEEIGLR